MTIAIPEKTITSAWLAALEYLQSHGEQLNLVTSVSCPDPTLINAAVLNEANDWLRRKDLQWVETVANTIFPEAYSRGFTNRQQFYERYMASLPRLMKQRQNRHGTYFGRMIAYPLSATSRRSSNGSPTNQIESIIVKLQQQLQGERPKRFAYEAQIFAPEVDRRKLMSFPCLSHLSFQIDNEYKDRRLCLTAMYRNQYYFERALGNFLGLARLLKFVSGQSGLKIGSLTIHACHAEIDRLGSGDSMQLIESCREHLSSV